MSRVRRSTHANSAVQRSETATKNPEPDAIDSGFQLQDAPPVLVASDAGAVRWIQPIAMSAFCRCPATENPLPNHPRKPRALSRVV